MSYAMPFICRRIALCFIVVGASQDGGIDVLAGGYRKKSPWGQWVQYNDKRGRGVFYYNVVSEGGGGGASEW
jgi:hypothetical protein